MTQHAVDCTVVEILLIFPTLSGYSLLTFGENRCIRRTTFGCIVGPNMFNHFTGASGVCTSCPSTPAKIF